MRHENNRIIVSNCVTLQLGGKYLIASPPGPWQRPFATTRIAAGGHPVHGYTQHPERVPLYRTVRMASGRPALQFWPGLERAVRGAIAAHGLRADAVTAPVLGDEAPACEVTDECAPADPVISFAARHGRGVVRLAGPGRFDALPHLATLANAFGSARVVCVVPNSAREWGHRLAAHVPGVGVSTHRRSDDPGRVRVFVSHPGALGVVGLDRAGLVLAVSPRLADDPLLEPEAEWPPPPDGVYRVNVMERLADARGKLFALVSAHGTLSRFEAARRAQVFGTDELELFVGGGAGRRATVAWARGVGVSPAMGGATGLEVKRRAVWQNDRLNRRAAAVARALRGGDESALGRLLPHAPALGPGRRVLVLVEGPEHAERIAPMLPGWPAVRSDRRCWPGTPGVVATAAGVASLRSGDFDALVRLDQGFGPLPAPPGWFADDGGPPALVVDFDCREHPALRRAVASRRAAYLSSGWPDAGEPADAFALRQLLARIAPRRVLA